ncbi:MAG TPA: Gfo/Idh/MocA family oxidoreductase [Paludibacteraceae bacterium]|nr:Gfo/Idh/MocA family oxidoreductase [Paludibacteraceae bacterium]HRU63238.1 Gfo/Idh/MocA family oxidoreductase [Paludibacteraceae bacterium]
MTKKICVVGGGKWGQNHIRTLYQLGNLGGIVEANSEYLSELLKLYPVEGFIELEQALEKDFDGFTVAVPAPLHYEVTKKIIESGKSVLVEKPMTLSTETSRELVELAERKGVQLMVGHVLLFHPAIRKIKKIIDSGELGNLYYLYSNRLNLGTVRTEENVFWSFAPHDISVLDYFVGHSAEKIVSKGSKFLQENVYDVTITQLDYPNNVHAHIFVSWLHPFKEQRLVVIGSKGMISFDDASIDKEIKFYDKRIHFEKGIPVKVENPTRIIPYEQKQPLTEELKYFIEHLDKKIEIADGRSGLEVVKVLEEAEKKLRIGSQ